MHAVRAMQVLCTIAWNALRRHWRIQIPSDFGLRPERSTADTIEQCFRVSRKTCRLCRGKDQRVSEIDMPSTA